MAATNPETSRPNRGIHRALAALLLTAPILVAFIFPIAGLLIAVLALPLLAYALRGILWPRSSPKSSVIHAGLIGLWLVGFALGEAVFTRQDSAWSAMVWLVMPLCGPPSFAAVVIPALVAAACSFAGLLGSAAAGRPSLWLAGSFVSPVAYGFASQQFGPFLC